MVCAYEERNWKLDGSEGESLLCVACDPPEAMGRSQALLPPRATSGSVALKQLWMLMFVVNSTPKASVRPRSGLPSGAILVSKDFEELALPLPGHPEKIGPGVVGAGELAPPLTGTVQESLALGAGRLNLVVIFVVSS